MGLSRISFTVDNSKVTELLKSLLDMNIQDLEIEKSEDIKVWSSQWDAPSGPSGEVVIRKDSDKDSPSLKDFKKNTLVPNWQYQYISTTADD